MNMKALTGKKQLLATTLALALVIGAVGFIVMSDNSDAEIQTVYISGTLDSKIEGGANQEFIVNGDLKFIANAGIILNAGNTLTVNEGCTMTLEEGSEFTINDGGKAYVNGIINVNGKQVLTMMNGSEMNVAGTLNVNAENTLNVMDGATLNIPGYLNVNAEGSAIFTGNVNVSGNAAIYGVASGKVNLTKEGAALAINSAKTALNLVVEIIDNATVNAINVAGSVDIVDKAGSKVNLSNVKAITITHVLYTIVGGNPIVSDANQPATIAVNLGVAQIDNMITSDVRIYIEEGAELKVAGALKAEKDNGVPMIYGKGALTVTGYDSVITTALAQPLVINTKSNPDAGLAYNGVTYQSGELNYYVTIARAIDDTKDKRPIEIDVFGDVVIDKDLIIPDDVTLDLTEANSLTVKEGVTVTIEKDLNDNGAGGNIKTTDTPVYVDGTIVIQDKTDSTLMNDDAVIADVTLEDGNELTYTNLQNALDTVSPGETITLRKDVALTDDLTIPEYVTLDLDGYELYVDDAGAVKETVTITVQGLLDATDVGSFVDLATKGQIVIDDVNLGGDEPYYPFVKFAYPDIGLNVGGTDPANPDYSLIMSKIQAALFRMDADGTGTEPEVFVLTSVLGTEANMDNITGDVVVVTYDFLNYTEDLDFTSEKEIGFYFQNEFTTDGNIAFGDNPATFHDNLKAAEIHTNSEIVARDGVNATFYGTSLAGSAVSGYVELVNVKGCVSSDNKLELYIDEVTGDVVFKGDIIQDVAGFVSSATFGGEITIIGEHVGETAVDVDFIIDQGSIIVVKPVMSVIDGKNLNLYEIFSDVTVPADSTINFVAEDELGNAIPAVVVIGGEVVVNGKFGEEDGKLTVAVACEDKHTHALTVAENAFAFIRALAVAGDVNIAGTLEVIDLFTNTDLTVSGSILTTGDAPSLAELKGIIEMYFGTDVAGKLKENLDKIDPVLFPLVQDVFNTYKAEDMPGAIVARNIVNSGYIDTNVVLANGDISNTNVIDSEIIGATGDIILGGTVPSFAVAAMGNVSIPAGATVQAAYVSAFKAVDIDGTLETPEMITIKELRDIVYTYLQTEIEAYLSTISTDVLNRIYAIYNAVNGFEIPSVILGTSVDIAGEANADVIAAYLLPKHAEYGIEGGFVNISGTVDATVIASTIITFEEGSNKRVPNGGAVDISGTVDAGFIGGGDMDISGTVTCTYLLSDNAIDVSGNVTASDNYVPQPDKDLNGSVVAESLNVTGTIDATVVEVKQKVTVAADGNVFTDLFKANDLDLAGKLDINGMEGYLSTVPGTANIDAGELAVADEMHIGIANVINGGKITTDATADVHVEELFVGIAAENIFASGKKDISAGTVGDMVTLDAQGEAYVSANSTVGTGIKQFASTEFYTVNTYYQPALWFTAYQNGAVVAINDVVEGTDKYAYIDGWRYTATFPGQIIEDETIGYPEAVYQNIRYDIYSVTVVADPAIGGVYIENMPLSKSGNVFYMDSNMSYNSNKTSYAVSGNLNNGYKGTFADNVSMYVNGELRENFDFVLPENTHNLQQIDIKISLAYDASGVPSDTGGLTLIETLLIIITAAIIVIGVVVIFRMLRS